MRAELITAVAVVVLLCDCKEQVKHAPPDRKQHVADLLARLDAALGKASPALATRLRPGASEAQIAAFEKYLGNALPETLKDLYRWHNGVELVVSGKYDPPGLFFQYWMGSLEDVQNEHAMKTKMWKDGTYARTARGGDGWWNERWIPFLSNMEGGTVCVDVAGWSTGDVGQVLEEWHDDSARKIVYRDLDAWLETFVGALETGVLHKVSDSESIEAGVRQGEEGPGYERWIRYHREHNPGYPKWLRAVGGH